MNVIMCCAEAQETVIDLEAKSIWAKAETKLEGTSMCGTFHRQTAEQSLSSVARIKKLAGHSCMFCLMGTVATSGL